MNRATFRYFLTTLAAAALTLSAQQQTPPPAGFPAQADANRDGFVTREEIRAALAGWRGSAAEFTRGVETAFPESVFMTMISPPQTREPKPEDVQKMRAALPESAPAKPRRPRKVLVLNKCAGFVHSCIPLAAKTMEELGAKTGAWTATVTYDAAAITAENLKQYDAVFLNNTTGAFLDDADAAVTAARKQTLLSFVRGGKGLAGIHAASDSYHASTQKSEFIGMIAGGMFAAADQDQNKTVDAAELNALGDGWFDRLDTAKAGKVSLAQFQGGFGRVLFASLSGRRRAGGGGPPAQTAGRPGPDTQVATWPEFNRMIGGFFKYHWNDPQHIVYKIDDPQSPINAPFRGGFAVDDETYTFGIKSWNRKDLHVLTSVDYARMSDADKAKEDFPRSDHDYGLSWIRREGKGRVFYTAHGHSERVYAMRPMLEHLLAGVQYALGDLKANDKPGK